MPRTRAEHWTEREYSTTSAMLHYQLDMDFFLFSFYFFFLFSSSQSRIGGSRVRVEMSHGRTRRRGGRRSPPPRGGDRGGR